MLVFFTIFFGRLQKLLCWLNPMVADRGDRSKVNFSFLQLSFLLYLFAPRIIPVASLFLVGCYSKTRRNALGSELYLSD